MATILIVDDEPLLGRTLRASLVDDGHDVHWVASGEEALEWLDGRQADLVLLDLRLPGIDGMGVLKEIVGTHADAAVVIMTAHGNVPLAVEAMKLGASDFLVKPVDLDTLSIVARKNLKHRRMRRELEHEHRERAREFGLHQIIGDCPGIQRAKALVRKVCTLTTDADTPPPNVLITGETGTGKDLLAKALHNEGPRSDGPFVHVNCAALPEALVESELFGHAKGSFTSAASSKRGLFEVADSGTLFLDEVSALPLGMQAKLLTAIETRRVRPVGSVEDRAVDVHLIAAMNADPQRVVADGAFRGDLYHRLRVIHIEMPPLRERGPDLIKLAQHFIAVHAGKFSMPPKTLSPEARRALTRYTWPGNVRELCHALESAVLLSKDTIEADHIPAPRPQTAAVCAPGFVQADFSRGPVPFDVVERELILKALQAAGHNVSRAAELLDVSRDTMRYRIDKHRLTVRRNGATG